MSWLSAVVRRVREEPWRFTEGLLAGVGTGWLFVEVADWVGKSPGWLDGWPPKSIMIACALISGVRQTVPLRRQRIRLPNSDTTLTLKVGDLFGEDGHRVVSVNEYFDGELGTVVAETSLHGRLIQRCYGSSADDFCAAVDLALLGQHPTRKARDHSRCDSYAIGTTVEVRPGNERYLLVALTSSDPTTHQASASVTDLWIALMGLWRSARSTVNGGDIVVPLLGSGMARVGLPQQVLAELIVLSLIVATKEQKVTNRVTLVIHDSQADCVDLSVFSRRWIGEGR